MIEVEKGGAFGRNTRRAAQVKKRPHPMAPRADELHMDQLRRIAACLVSGSTGAEPPTAAADGPATSTTSHRETLFRTISLLHSAIDATSPYSRDKAILQYGREVESNRELWRKMRHGIKKKLRRLQKESSRSDGNMEKLLDFCDDVTDAMDELLGDEPYWMCGPTTTWETQGIRIRARSLRQRIEKIFKPTESDDGDDDDDDSRTGVEKDDDYSASPRKVRFEMDSDPEPSDDDGDGDEPGSKSPPVPSSAPKDTTGSSTPLAGVIRNENTADDDDASKPDRYAAMIRGSAKLDPTIMNISLAALVSELCTARSRANSERGGKTTKSEQDAGYQPLSAVRNQSSAEDQALELKQAVLNYSDLILKSFPLFNQFKDIPHPNLAAVAMLRHSFMANDQSPSIFSGVDSKGDAGNDILSGGCDDDDDDDDEDTDESDRSVGEVNANQEEGLDMSLIADDIATTGRKFIADTRLKVFPELHITTAIATIAAILPPSAAEILSRPCCLDELNHRTPFDLMRSALEDMESRGQISHGDGVALSSLAQHDVINVSKLVSELVAAADAASDCAEKDEGNPLYISWQLALLAGATCVSSGIIIGRGAQRAASDYYDDRGAAVRRTRTDNHGEVRLLAANSFRRLLEQCNSARYQAIQRHVAVSSFLEWKEATCLLMSRGVNDTEYFRRIRRLHAHHTIEWVKVERSDTALVRVQELNARKEVNADVPLMLLADRLEQEPDDDQRWMHLASALGSLGDLALTQEERSSLCSQEGCKECPKLQKHVSVDHGELSRRKQEQGWWGDGRAEWWEQLFFSTSSVDIKDSTILSVCSSLDELVEARGENEGMRHIYNDTIVGIGPQQSIHLDPVWLASSENENDFYFSSDDEDDDDDDNDDEEDVVSTKGKKGASPMKFKTYDEFLPKHISDVCRHGISSYLAEMSQPFEEHFLVSTSTDTRQYATNCCKVLVACHLFGLNHPFVANNVVHLAVACPQVRIGGHVTTDRRSCQFLFLLWLAKLGLNVQQIIQDAVVDAECRSGQDGRKATKPYGFAPLDL